MKATREEGKAERPAEHRAGERGDRPPLAVRAPARGEDAEGRREETPEEPGYGHGV
jgi:hypothetical protein